MFRVSFQIPSSFGTVGRSVSVAPMPSNNQTADINNNNKPKEKKT